MRLSEAIRLGAMMKPQGFYGLVVTGWVSVKTCALGAALDAVGRLDATKPATYSWMLVDAMRDFGWGPVLDASTWCPAR